MTLKPYLKYSLKTVAVILGLLVLAYIAGYIYIAANKKSIINQIKQQVAEKLNGEIQLGNIELSFFSTFPSVSVLIENFSIQDTLFNQHKHPFFKAEKAYALISLMSVIKKNNPLSGLKIQNGHLYVYTDTSGYTNSYLFSPKSKTAQQANGPKSQTNIDDIKLKNVRFTLDDRKKGKLYDFDLATFNADIKSTGVEQKIKCNNDILVHNLAFKTKNGSFLKEARFEGKYELYYNKDQKRLSFNDITVKIKDHPFKLTGAFNFSKDSANFKLKVSTSDINYDLAKSILTDKISRSLSIVKLHEPVVEVNAEISGELNGDPLVNATYKVSDNSIESPYGNFTDCSLTGSYTNELIQGQPRKDPNSRLHFQNFQAKWEGLKIVSKNIYIDNLVIPIIKCDLKTDFRLAELNNILESNTIEFNEGNGLVDLTYNGPLGNNSNKNTLINGKVVFSDGTMVYSPRNILLKDVKGNIIFKNTDVFVTDLRSNVQGNKIVMNGTGKNLLAFLKTNPGKLFVDWNIYSPSLDLGTFTSLLKKRTVRLKNRAKSKLGSTAQNLDAIVNQANFRLNVKADQLAYKRFTASNVRASLELINENWSLNKVSLQHGGGSMEISGSLIEKNARYYAADIKSELHNVDVNKVMYAFNDFGQDGISYKNLRGRITTRVNINMDIDRDLEGTPNNMRGFVDFSLKNGALIDYVPLQKIQNIVFKNRNFSDIHFAELKDRMDINGKEITINRMEIQSTVLTLFVEGVFSLRGNTDISVQVPLSNIKKRDENYVPENKGVDAKAGASIYVRGKPGDDGNIQFKLDLFKKLRKDDNEKKEEKKEAEEKKEEEKKQKAEEKKADTTQKTNN